MLKARLAKKGIVVAGQAMDIVLCGWPPERPRCPGRIACIVESPRTKEGVAGDRELHFLGGFHKRPDGAWAQEDRVKDRLAKGSRQLDRRPSVTTKVEVCWDVETGQELGYFTTRRPAILPVDAYCPLPACGRLNTLCPDDLRLTGSPEQKIIAPR
jgi:hypothetical protein